MEEFQLNKFMNLSHFEGPPEECEETSLHKHFKNHTNYIAHKWEHYIPIYHKLFAPYILEKKAINLLEIGVSNGGSLEIWQNFLPEGSYITGVDIAPACKEILLPSHARILIGDISKGELINTELKDAKFDVIIDDASHKPHHIFANFTNTFDMLHAGGLYIIEDCHTSYWKEFHGALHRQDATIEYFKRMIDALNYCYFKDEAELSHNEKEFYEKYNAQIASLAFYDSMIVIEKYIKRKNAPFRNYVFGEQAPIVQKDFLLTIGLECKANTKFEKFYKN